MDDVEYNARYKIHMQAFLNETFKPDKMNELFDLYHQQISPYVVGPEAKEEVKYTHLTNTNVFTSELQALQQHVATQYQLAIDYLK
jgi:hypothetical protein